MNLDLTDEQKAIRELDRKFADEEIAPSAKERNEKEIFPGEILRKMGPLGFLGGPGALARVFVLGAA